MRTVYGKFTSFSENFSNISVGSAPGVKTKTNGVDELESSKVVAISNGGGIVNFGSSRDSSVNGTKSWRVRSVYSHLVGTN